MDCWPNRPNIRQSKSTWWAIRRPTSLLTWRKALPLSEALVSPPGKRGRWPRTVALNLDSKNFLKLCAELWEAMYTVFLGGCIELSIDSQRSPIMGWIVWPSNAYLKALTLNVTEFGDGAFREVIRVNWGGWSRSCLQYRFWFPCREVPLEKGYATQSSILGLPWWLDGNEPTCSVAHLSSIPVLGSSPGGGHGNPLQDSCLENSHGERSLVCHSSRGHQESDTTEWPSTTHPEV